MFLDVILINACQLRYMAQLFHFLATNNRITAEKNEWETEMYL